MLPKKQLVEYDRTHQGKIAREVSVLLCQSCAMERMIEGLRQYSAALVVMAPIRKYNTYATYHFDALLREAPDKNEEFVEDLKSMLPQAGTPCRRCGKPAAHTWGEQELIRGDWAINFGAAVEHLCPDCVADALRENIEKQGMELRFIYPPVDGEGVFMPWEC